MRKQATQLWVAANRLRTMGLSRILLTHQQLLFIIDPLHDYTVGQNFIFLSFRKVF